MDVRSSSDARRPANTTEYPAECNARLTARPMPLPAPVTSAIRLTRLSSHNFPKANDDFVGLPFADAYNHRASKPRMLRCASLETRHAAEVISRWVNALTLVQSPQNLGRPVTHAAIHHIDQCAIVGLNGVAGVVIGRTLRTHNLPIRPDGQDTTLQPRTRNSPAGNRNDAPMSSLRLSQIEHCMNVSCNVEGESQLGRCHSQRQEYQMAPSF